MELYGTCSALFLNQRGLKQFPISWKVLAAFIAKIRNFVIKGTKFPHKYSANIRKLWFEMLRPKHNFGRSEYEANTSAEAEKKLRPKRSFVRTLINTRVYTVIR